MTDKIINQLNKALAGLPPGFHEIAVGRHDDSYFLHCYTINEPSLEGLNGFNPSVFDEGDESHIVIPL